MVIGTTPNRSLRTLAFLASALLVSVSNGETGRVEVDAIEIEYEISGSGDLVVLLEAGGSNGLERWDSIFADLSGQHRVLRYSRVGNGNSEKPNRHFVVEDFASHLERLLDALGIDKVAYVAHSYGGSVARTFCAKHPDRVACLLLVDSASEHDVEIMRSIDLGRANREIDEVKLQDILSGKNNYITDFWAKFPLPDYPEIPDVPVTVIASVKQYEDPPYLFFTDEGRRRWGDMWTTWAQSFPQGKIALTDKSYHDVPSENPELVIREVIELVSRISQ